MVDLAAQLAAIRPEVDAAFADILNNTGFIGGPYVEGFRSDLEAYLDGAAHVIPCANGTDALQLALMALELPRGAEVITPSFTYIATVEAAALLGLTPVLVDVDPHTFCLTPASVESAITPRTGAIIPVHLFGQCAPMAELQRLADAAGIPLIEDAAQAIGARARMGDADWQPAGTIGRIGCTSFYPSKNLGAYGDAGALFCPGAALAARLRQLANHGQATRYTFDDVGVNSRLDAFQAAVLQIKLRHLDRYIANRRWAADAYDERLAGVAGLQRPRRQADSTHVFHQYTIRVAGGRRDALQAHLKEQGIPSVVFYPRPAHLQPAYAGLGYRTGDLPVSEQLAGEVLSLPMHSELTEAQIDFITGTINGFLS